MLPPLHQHRHRPVPILVFTVPHATYPQDVLGRFQGDWALQPVTDPTSGAVVGCRCELHQDVLPKGAGRGVGGA